MTTLIVATPAKVASVALPFRAVGSFRRISPEKCGQYVPKPLFKGNGYLAGSAPDGLVTVEGVPTGTAEIRVLWRPAAGTFGEGVLVATTISAPDGTWQVSGLNTALKFDVVARYPGFNDVIMTNISPAE